MIAARKGLTGEVPHWYCYIPFFPSADCWRSFGQGTAELVGGTVGAAIGGAASGAADQLGFKPLAEDTNWWMWIGFGAAGVLVFALSGGRRR